MVINSIKQKILQLDSGSFQNLCDAILVKEGYSNILSLGTHAGTQKTTKGTPDTYFYDNDNKYIFVEYTVQQSNLINKIEDDLTKCLDVSKTGITTDQISEILYFHTSSNIPPGEDKRFKEKCEKLGIALKIRGIDYLSHELYSKHKNIAKDILGISIDTDQIKDLNDFIKIYNSNKFASPIDNAFLFRENELTEIEEAFNSEDVVIVSGPSGAGKTKLCVQFSENFSEKESRQLFCIRDNALPIHEDLKLYLDNPGKYFIFIDDANQLGGLQHVLQYTQMNAQGYDVKILVSVRDYAALKLKIDIKKVTSFEEIEVKEFSRDEVKTLIEKEFGITSELYIDRIFQISEGNARIAMLAGKIASEAHRLSSINDVSQLYDEYYGCIIKDTKLFDDTNVLIVAGIMSVFRAFHLDHIDTIMPILSDKQISEAIFIESIKKLHEYEIVDICHDKAVNVSEQCLANFLLKYVFYDTKALELSTVIEIGFLKFRQQTIEAINTLNMIFRNDELQTFTKYHVMTVWNKFKEENNEYFFEFVRTFYLMNPSESLLLIQEKINNISPVHVSIDSINVDEGKNHEIINDNIINILGGFDNRPELDIALDLFFQYYLKRPDLFMEFYHGAHNYFGINKYSYLCEYHTQMRLFTKIKEYSDNWKNEYIKLLFFELASHFLCFDFNRVEASEKHKMVIYNIPLIAEAGANDYRKIIWESLSEICQIQPASDNICRLLNSYGRYLGVENKNIVTEDLKYIVKILEVLPFEESLFINIIAHEIKMNVERMGWNEIGEHLAKYIDTSKMFIYNLLSTGNCNTETDYYKKRNIRKQNIEKYVSDNIQHFKEIIDVCEELSFYSSKMNFYNQKEGLSIAFDSLQVDSTILLEIVEYYLAKNTPLNINPVNIIPKMFECTIPSQVLKTINKSNYRNKNTWNYAYYHELPATHISKEELNGLYEFLNDKSDLDIIDYTPRDVTFIKKFNTGCDDAFRKCCNIILSKKSYSPHLPCLYFESLFNEYHTTPSKTLDLFEDNIGLLKDIYIHVISMCNSVDVYGIFLKDLYLKEKSIIMDYIELFFNSSIRYGNNLFRKLCSFYNTEDYYEIFDFVIDEIIKREPYPNLILRDLISELILPTHEDSDLLKKQDGWIRSYIQKNSHNAIKMKHLFSSLAEMEHTCKLSYVRLLLDCNSDFSLFEKIPLTPFLDSWSGSAVPVYSSYIDYLTMLLPHLTGLTYLKHKNRVENLIEYWRESIKSAEIREALDR